MSKIKNEMATRCELAMMGIAVPVNSNDEVQAMTEYIMTSIGKDTENLVDIVENAICKYLPPELVQFTDEKLSVTEKDPSKGRIVGQAVDTGAADSAGEPPAPDGRRNPVPAGKDSPGPPVRRTDRRSSRSGSLRGSARSRTGRSCRQRSGRTAAD